MTHLFSLLLFLAVHQYSDGIRCYRCIPRADDTSFCINFGRNRRGMEQVDCPRDNKCAKFIGDTVPTSTGVLAIRGCPSDDALSSFPRDDSLVNACSLANSTQVSFLPRHQFLGELCYCSTDECNSVQGVRSQDNAIYLLLTYFLSMCSSWY